MNYIIDGHNLIPKIEGLSLSMPDDEQRLIDLLNRYGEIHRHRMEVYFDGAPFGSAGARNYGMVRAHFVRKSLTADDAIRIRLAQSGRAIRNWVVVSSDHNVQAIAHEAQTQVMSSEEFAQNLQASLLQTKPRNSVNIADEPISDAELKEWLMIFKEQSKRK